MLRNPRVGLVAYVPPGSIKAGETLVMTGGNGKTQACGTCHGPDMRGTAIAPPLAGRHPGYMARQLYDFQVGARNGDMAAVMKPSVEKLTEDDLIAMTAYLASLAP
jgi:cytochrome c553